MEQRAGSGWRHAKGCEAGHCVEVRRRADGTVDMRDREAPEDMVLTFTPRAWAAFVAGVKRGEFDPR